MKKRHAVALLLILGIAAIVGVFGHDLWWAVAYRKTKFLAVDAEMDAYAKRWLWLPGPALHLPKQLCVLCQTGLHNQCIVVLATALPEAYSSDGCTCTTCYPEGE